MPTPTFDGNTDVNQLIKDFELVVQGNQWSAEEMGLRLQLALKGDTRKQELT